MPSTGIRHRVRFRGTSGSASETSAHRILVLVLTANRRSEEQEGITRILISCSLPSSGRTHWGGSGDDGVGHPIRSVFDDLNLTTLCDGIITNLIETLFGPERESERPRQAHKGLARDFEATIAKTKVGSKALDLLRRHRVDAVALVARGDGRRAAIAALAPILKDKSTVAENAGRDWWPHRTFAGHNRRNPQKIP